MRDRSEYKAQYMVRDGSSNSLGRQGRGLGHGVQLLLVATLIDERAKHALFILEQLTRLAELDDVSGIENHL